MKTRYAFPVVLLLAGCAYQPVVDRPNAQYHQDLNDCRAHAGGVAGPGTTAAVGAGIGFGLGFVICSALGGRDCSSTGRATAVMGAASGGAAGARDESQVVRNCLLNRGHRVLN